MYYWIGIYRKTGRAQLLGLTASHPSSNSYADQFSHYHGPYGAKSRAIAFLKEYNRKEVTR